MPRKTSPEFFLIIKTNYKNYKYTREPVRVTGLEPILFCSQNRHITYYATPGRNQNRTDI
jgi:hypothetical protein